MKLTKEELFAELDQCESSILYYTPIYEANIEKYNYCHKEKKSKDISELELNMLRLQEEQSHKIITKYKSVMKYLEKKRMRLRKKLGIKDIPKKQSQPGEE